MEHLYLETAKGIVQIDDSIVEKYNLEKGTLSPFTHNCIVDYNGEFIRKEPPKENRPSLMQGDDDVDTMENGIRFSTSEILDIAEGVDSV